MSSGRAERLEELGTLLAAGVETDRALATVGVGGRRGPVLEHLLDRGLLHPREQPRLAIMFEIGRLDRGLRQLAAQLRQEGRQVGLIKGRLVLPVAIWVIAILIAPLPALFRAELGLAQYVGAVLLPLLLTAALLWLGFRYWRTLLDTLRDLQLRMGGLPGLGLRLCFLRDLNELLAGGLDAEQALSALVRGASGEWRRRLDAARAEIRGGAGLVGVLARHRLLHRRHDVPVLSAGESAGRLEQALEHRVARVSEERDLRMEVVAEWLPRVVYFLVVVQLLRGFL